MDDPDTPLEFEFVGRLSSRAIVFVAVASGVDPFGPRGTSSSLGCAVFAPFVTRKSLVPGSRFFIMSLMSDGLRAVCSLGCRAYSFASYKTKRWAQFVLSFRLIRVLASFRWLPSSSLLHHHLVHQVRWFRAVIIVRAVVLFVLSLFVVFLVGPVFVPFAALVIAMADNIDEITPAPVTSSCPPATASVPVVESVDESVVTPSNPTMAALFDIFRARSSSSVAPPPVPVAIPSGYVASPWSLGVRRM